MDLFLDPLFALANAPLEESRPEPMQVGEPAPLGAAPGESIETAIPVSILNHTAKDVLQGAFPRLWVRGEVTDFKRHRNGHWYFCLGDGEATVRCVVWSRDQRRIPASPDEGMQLSVRGQLTVYPARGDMQLVVTAMEAEGDGLTRKAIEQVLRRLEADGLLAPERKRPLPRFPRRIAVVTSPDGAAIRDVVAVARRRSPGVEIVIVPAAVQGDGAPDELCAALDKLARWGDCDVAIVGRGGGGKDDLRAFNDEQVARALAALPMPVISAVGHEIDMSICDLVADLRAPTPSAAAEAAVPVQAEVIAQVAALRDALAEGARWQIEQATARADSL
ncbi:MAG TPA: exodeoxyribonuclease VII large subunit, partial [Gemmatimonadaceae bacterium]|nr:exodeoxyribonuclease VII large subunit [Gemmatimonadaceae bacterium]